MSSDFRARDDQIININTLVNQYRILSLVIGKKRAGSPVKTQLICDGKQIDDKISPKAAKQNPISNC